METVPLSSGRRASTKKVERLVAKMGLFFLSATISELISSVINGLVHYTRMFEEDPISKIFWLSLFKSFGLISAAICNGSNFFLYFFSGTMFREELASGWNKFKFKFKCKCCCKNTASSGVSNDNAESYV